MSSYAELADVQAQIPQFILSETSKPSQADSDTFLNAAVLTVEATVQNLGYVVPITGEKSLAVLKPMVVWLTIETIMDARANAVGSDSARATAKWAREKYDARLAALMDDDNPLTLSDAEKTEDFTDKPTNMLGGTLVDENGDEVVPRVTMTMRF